MERLRQANAETGFTLIELMIAIAVIAILAATAIPYFMNREHKTAGSSSKQYHPTIQEGKDIYCAGDVIDTLKFKQKMKNYASITELLADAGKYKVKCYTSITEFYQREKK